MSDIENVKAGSISGRIGIGGEIRVLSGLTRDASSHAKADLRTGDADRSWVIGQASSPMNNWCSGAPFAGASVSPS